MNTEEIFRILPENIKVVVANVKDIKKLQEIRIKIKKPIIIICDNKEILTKYISTYEDLRIILKRISGYSMYAFEEEIRKGYITIKGGHRIGLCGSCVMDKGVVKTIKDIGSLNIRICREIIGISDDVMPYIVENNKVVNTILISPPKCGKTTLLRDITRNISNGIKNNRVNIVGEKVCIIDERGEIGGCYRGVPEMDIGIRTDILDNCFKSEGIIMAIRSMGPEVIVCDEIGTYDDIESIVMAMNSGVNLIVTIHGFGIEDLYKRPVFKKLLDNGIFKRGIVLSSRRGTGTIEYIYDFYKKDKMWGR